ncbi:MAG: hypothetical protein WC889_17055, partial [Myxococcota bacterium]
ATSGWNGSAYDNAKRLAGPFAILDTVYSAMLKIVSADSTVAMPALPINWSILNFPGKSGDVTKGEIGTSKYSSEKNQLYILGKENSDTDEYDDHVVAHEWGHYFENKFSRSDSLGSDHGSGEKLDPRVAFGEGFGNGFSGMCLDDPDYIDSKGAQQGTVGLYMNLDDSNGDPESIGWFSEDSVQYILYQLYKNKSIGFKPFYTVFTGSQKTTDSFTTIHSFAYYMRQQYSSSEAAIDTLLNAKSITPPVNIWATTEANNGGDPKSLPVYNLLTVGGAAVVICVNDEFGYYNKLMNRHFAYFEITQEREYTVTAQSKTAGGVPNIWVLLKGDFVAYTENKESGTISTPAKKMSPGKYAVDIYDNRMKVQNDPKIGEVCFDVTLN